MFRRLTPLSLTIAAGLAIAAPAHAQNADAGKTVFKQICGICHEIVANKNRIGPSLFGVVGRKSGTEVGYNYSDENKGAALTWDEPTLDRYLVSPRSVVPGTKMAYAGLKDDQKRKDLIAFLATLK